MLMDKSVFEKYIEEMRRMQAKSAPIKTAAPPPTPPKPITHTENGNDMQGEGYLVVNVTSVRGLYPIEGADVTVFTGEADSPTVVATATTDQSGKTPPIPLPAPSVEFSESPDPSERPFAYYNIRTVEDGFRENLNFNLAIFDKVTSLQTITLEPMTTEIEQNRPIVIDEFENYGL